MASVERLVHTGATVGNSMTTYIRNKRAKFDYEILETFEAGLVLVGHEVKAVRAGKGSLLGAYIVIDETGAELKGATITPYQEKNTPTSYDPERPRRLLLSKKELAELKTQGSQAGLTIVPIRLYNNGRNIKLEIAIVRGKKKADKRESIKARDTKRDIDRILKNQ